MDYLFLCYIIIIEFSKGEKFKLFYEIYKVNIKSYKEKKKERISEKGGRERDTEGGRKRRREEGKKREIL